MNAIIGIDPGTKKSAFVRLYEGSIVEKVICNNKNILRMLKDQFYYDDVLAMEMMNYQSVEFNKYIRDTCIWTGKFLNQWQGKAVEIERRKVFMHFFRTPVVEGADKLIRRRIIGLYGGSEEKAIGSDRNKGPLHGVKSHMWQALAVAIVARDTRQ